MQLAVYGKESMRRMATANVLICGLGGLGVEVGERPWLRCWCAHSSLLACVQSMPCK